MTSCKLQIAGYLAGCVLASLFNVDASSAASLAPGFTSSPGQIIYNYASPQVAIHAGVQVGNNVTTTVTQSSSHNVSGVVQIGNSTNAEVRQTGAGNYSAVSQYSRVNAALLIQFGPSASLLGQ